MIAHKIAQASSNLMCLFAPAGRLKNMLLTRFFPIFPGAPAAGSRRSARAIAMRCFLGGERKEQPWNSHGTAMDFNYPLVNIQKNYGKSPFLLGKSTISMVMFNSYVNVYQRVFQFKSKCDGIAYFDGTACLFILSILDAHLLPSCPPINISNTCAKPSSSQRISFKSEFAKRRCNKLS